MDKDKNWTKSGCPTLACSTEPYEALGYWLIAWLKGWTAKLGKCHELFSCILEPYSLQPCYSDQIFMLDPSHFFNKQRIFENCIVYRTCTCCCAWILRCSCWWSWGHRGCQSRRAGSWRSGACRKSTNRRFEARLALAYAFWSTASPVMYRGAAELVLLFIQSGLVLECDHQWSNTQSNL